MTLTNQIPLMTAEELSQFHLHIQNLNFDADDHGARYRVVPTKDGLPYLQALPYDHPPFWSRNSIKALNGMIYRGLVDVSTAADGHPIIHPKGQNPHCLPRQEQPVAWMTPVETAEFDHALQTVRRHSQMGHCVFESWLDHNTNLFTRTRVNDHAPHASVTVITSALHTLSRRLHEGSAVRVPLPEGGVIYLARWDLRPEAERPASGC